MEIRSRQYRGGTLGYAGSFRITFARHILLLQISLLRNHAAVETIRPFRPSVDGPQAYEPPKVLHTRRSTLVRFTQRQSSAPITSRRTSVSG
jgi:hypothetical protein